MDTPLAILVERITHALEQVVAPEVASPIVRGQLFAAVELLHQLPAHYEVRHDFVVQDIARHQALVGRVAAALATAGLALPAEAAAGLEAVDAAAGGQDLLDARTKAEIALSAALNLLDANRATCADAAAVEAEVLGELQQGALRDLMLFRRPRFDRISQRAEEGDDR